MNHKVRMGIIGLGKMGTYHLNLCEEISGIELTSICDIDNFKLNEAYKKYGVNVYSDFNDLLNYVDAVIIAVPTIYHYEIAKKCLLAGKHVLVEKPITTNLIEAEELFNIAEKKNLILNIGHVERFNGAVQELKKIVYKPYFLESKRVGPYDIKMNKDSVVLDLLIHDIDIIFNIVNEDVVYIQAVGSPVFSEIADIACVHMMFNGNTIADMLVSRATQKKERTLSISQEDTFILLDYTTQDINIYRSYQSQHIFGNRELKYKNEYILERLFVYKDNPLKLEIRHFIDNILGKTQRIVTIKHELMSLKIALKIDELIAKHNFKEAKVIL